MAVRDSGSVLPAKGSLSEEDARLLLENVSDYAIFMLDLEGRVSSWNLGANRIKGYKADEIVGTHFSAFYPQEDVDRGKPERELQVVREEGRVEDEGWRVRKDGSTFWASVIITAIRDAHGELRGFGKITRDLTQRKLYEEQLRASDDRFHHLVDAVTDYAILMLDPEGRVATWNVGAERTKQYTAREIIGMHFSVFYPADDRAAGRPAKILASVRESGRFEEEGWRVRKDGTRFWANVVITSLRDVEGEIAGFVKVTRDLSERRQALEVEHSLVREQAARTVAEANERTLRESEQRAQASAKRAEDMAQRAEDANRLKDEFLATVSHELRTPLNSILGWSWMLKERNTDARNARALDAIHRNAQAQARIVDDILDVSRIITGKLSLDLQPTDFVATIFEALEVVRPSVLAKRLTVTFEPPAEPVLFLADRERLRQVVWNLLSNAVKFTEQDGRVEIALEQSPSSTVLTVRDSGRGIDKAVLPHVFERFMQEDSSNTRRFGGLGLGLAIVRHLVELHGGRVEAESEGLDRGATFRVTLPTSQGELARVSARGAEVEGYERTSVDAKALRHARVLVVDDDDDARQLLEGMFVAHGAIVDLAASVVTALAAIERCLPDVIISDIGMPHEDGHAFMRRLRARATEDGGMIPSIALTASASSSDRAKALAVGFTTYLSKPVAPDAVLETVIELLRTER